MFSLMLLVLKLAVTSIIVSQVMPPAAEYYWSLLTLACVGAYELTAFVVDVLLITAAHLLGIDK